MPVPPAASDATSAIAACTSVAATEPVGLNEIAEASWASAGVCRCARRDRVDAAALRLAPVIFFDAPLRATTYSSVSSTVVTAASPLIFVSAMSVLLIIGQDSPRCQGCRWGRCFVAGFGVGYESRSGVGEAESDVAGVRPACVDAAGYH